jgi:hypothetical protein
MQMTCNTMHVMDWNPALECCVCELRGLQPEPLSNLLRNAANLLEGMSRQCNWAFNGAFG